MSPAVLIIKVASWFIRQRTNETPSMLGQLYIFTNSVLRGIVCMCYQRSIQHTPAREEIHNRKIPLRLLYIFLLPVALKVLFRPWGNWFVFNKMTLKSFYSKIVFIQAACLGEKSETFQFFLLFCLINPCVNNNSITEYFDLQKVLTTHIPRLKSKW